MEILSRTGYKDSYPDQFYARMYFYSHDWRFRDMLPSAPDLSLEPGVVRVMKLPNGIRPSNRLEAGHVITPDGVEILGHPDDVDALLRALGWQAYNWTAHCATLAFFGMAVFIVLAWR